jgi:uncharacterized membrane protein YhaH (DUF805 family)
MLLLTQWLKSVFMASFAEIRIYKGNPMNQNEPNNFAGTSNDDQFAGQPEPQGVPTFETPQTPPQPSPEFMAQQPQSEPWQQAQEFNGANAGQQPAGMPQTGAPYAGPQAEYQQPTMGAPVQGGFTVAVPLDQPYYGCSFVEAVNRFFRKYATFSGRASRSEFWWVVLFTFLASTVAVILDSTIFGWNGTSGSNYFSSVFSLATLVPQIALMVRRLHDSNKSGAWFVLPYGLLFGGMIILVVSLIIGAGIGGDVESAGFTGGALIGLIIFLLCFIGGIVSYFVFTLAGPNPAGARFDKVNPMQMAAPTAAPQYTEPQQGVPFGGEQNMAQPMPTYPVQSQEPQSFGGGLNTMQTPEQTAPVAQNGPVNVQSPEFGQPIPDQNQQPQTNNGFDAGAQPPVAQ